ncbi:MAG: hypothetical protein GY799_29430 [Desulfobulbaceae bacterium]|nr:hypothetical protein [Desulfobulbaceae bacterium]
MYIEQMVTECDFTGREYHRPVAGAGGVARGATGRWCVVMHAGPEYIQDNGIVTKTAEQARKELTNHSTGEWCDF